MIKSFKVGDVLSESSHYKVLEEYEARRSQSTCVYSIITERMFEKGVD